MTVPRDLQLTPRQLALKQAARDLVSAAGGQDVVQEITGRARSRASDWISPNTPTFMPIDAVRELEAVTVGQAGHPIVTRMLARAAGYALVRLPQAEPASIGELHDALGRHGKEAGEVTAAICRALGEGSTIDVDAVKRHRIIEECDEGIEALVALRAIAASLGGA